MQRFFLFSLHSFAVAIFCASWTFAQEPVFKGDGVEVFALSSTPADVTLAEFPSTRAFMPRAEFVGAQGSSAAISLFIKRPQTSAASAPSKVDFSLRSAQGASFDSAAFSTSSFALGAGVLVELSIKSTQPPGIYTGKISLGGIGEIPLQVRVLPFALPEPRTRYDVSAPWAVIVSDDDWNNWEKIYRCADKAPDKARALEAVLLAGQKSYMRCNAAADYEKYGATLSAAFSPPAPLASTAQNTDLAMRWHMLSQRLIAYEPRTFSFENPEYLRRRYGLVAYISDFDGVAVDRGKNLSPLQRRALEDAIDDVRYLTDVMQFVDKTQRSKRMLVRIEGKKAADWISKLDPGCANLDVVRLEAIAFSLKLRAVLEQEDEARLVIPDLHSIKERNEK